MTLIHRQAELSERIKYWMRPDLQNRIKEGSIRAFFSSTVSAIEPGRLRLATPDGPRTIDNDFVIAMTGYRPSYPFLEGLGIRRGEGLQPAMESVECRSALTRVPGELEAVAPG